jgi:signal peptidase II
MTTRRAAAFAFVLLALFTAGCDHAVKHAARSLLDTGEIHTWLSGAVRFELVHNTGGFLSLGAQLAPAFRDAFFLFAAPLGVAVLALLSFRAAARSRSGIVGLAFVCGGGLANWLDRVLNAGAVTDFVSVGAGPLRTGIFNLADVAIMAGIALLLLPDRARAREAESADEA